jgi:hypothetical protein
MNRFLPCLFAAGLFCAEAPAQHASPTAARPAIDANKLTVLPYTPREFTADQLRQAAVELFGELLVVGGSGDVAQGGSTGFSTVPHFVVLGELLLIRDTKEAAADIAATLEALEAQERSRRESAERFPAAKGEYAATRSIEIRPRYVSFEALANALKPFSRKILYAAEGEQRVMPQSVHVIPDGNVIVVYETEARLKDVQALVARIDRPRPQMMMTVSLLHVATTPDEVESLPKELEQHLKSLLPARGFKTFAVGALRCAMQAGRQCELKAELENRGTWSLSFFPEAWSAETNEFSLSHCQFVLKTPDAPGSPGSSQSFDTSLTFRAGEYVVLGAVGENPTLVVLRAQTIAQAH